MAPRNLLYEFYQQYSFIIFLGKNPRNIHASSNQLFSCSEEIVDVLAVTLGRQQSCLEKKKNPKFCCKKSIAVMARHGTLSRRPAKEQPPADMRDDKTANTIDDQTHIPLPSLVPSIPCPASDRCATSVPVGSSRRSAPTISRFCPVFG